MVYISIYANIGGILMVNVTIYSIHGSVMDPMGFVRSSKVGKPGKPGDSLFRRHTSQHFSGKRRHTADSPIAEASESSISWRCQTHLGKMA